MTIVDRGPPGEGTSFGNAAVIEPHGVIPVPSPGVLWRVPRYLMNPRGPLAIRWSYLPRLTPWLARFVWNSRARQPLPPARERLYARFAGLAARAPSTTLEQR